jgi:hypothetical protein
MIRTIGATPGLTHIKPSVACRDELHKTGQSPKPPRRHEVTPIVPAVSMWRVTVATLIRNQARAIWSRCGRGDSVEGPSRRKKASVGLNTEARYCVVSGCPADRNWPDAITDSGRFWHELERRPVRVWLRLTSGTAASGESSEAATLRRCTTRWRGAMHSDGRATLRLRCG